ncbi:cytochrome-c oxidase, cbb3-type subunit III [Sulfuricystis thermophila]|uniref:cytochrome-c oxidase, cbb3-type subunit III n=1 Tax=Sulfuricystis thermophila TaxID=2496847 RepID=UPI001035710E|nr:cytochrome-c oxidase, cbb3-type subunit III [Sulfuricystis thermophila]
MDFNFTSDLVGFWNLFVVVIVAVSVIGCGVFLWVQGSAKFKPGEVTGHVWDETLEEYSNPLPNWWRWMFYITVVFAIVYLALYPGLGNNRGMFGWTMRGQYDEEMKAAEAKYGPIFNKFLQQDVMTVAADPEAREMGQRLFVTYCAQCHGSDAGGGPGFPNLKDNDWLWGGTPEKIKETITNGRMGVMTPKGTKPDMDAEQVKDVVAYVRSLSGLSHDSARAQRGAELYPQACAACHGPDAKGNPEAGYPNLTDKVWLYGSREETMIETVTKGRQNQMPAFGEFLGPAKVHLLTAYVWGLGGGVKPAPAAPQQAEAAPAAATSGEAAPAEQK